VKPSEQRIVQALLGVGLINHTQLQHMQAEQKKWGGKVHHFASELGIVHEDQVTAALARELKVPLLRLADLPVDRAALAMVSATDCERLVVYPAALRDDGKTLWLAMSDPLDTQTLDHVRARAGVPRVQAGIAGKKEILEAVHRSFTLLGRDGARHDIAVGAPVPDEFKIIDTAGRTQIRSVDELARRRGAARPGSVATPPAPVAAATVSAPAPAWAAPPVPRSALPLAAILLDAGVVDAATLGRASSIAVAGDVSVIFALARWRLVDPAVIAATLSRAFGQPIVALDSLAQAPALPVQRAACVRMRALPVWRNGSVVGLAMSDPTDHASVEALAQAHRVNIERLLVNDDDLERAFLALAARAEAGQGAPSSAPATVPWGTGLSSPPPMAGATWLPHASAPGGAGPVPGQIGAPMPASASVPPWPGATTAPAPASVAPVPAAVGVSATGGVSAVLSLVEGVLEDDGDVFGDGVGADPTQALAVTLDLAGATLDPHSGQEPSVPGGASGVFAAQATVSDQGLADLRVLAIASVKNAAPLRAALSAQIAEFASVTRFADGIALSAQRAFSYVIVVDPPSSVLRSLQFATLVGQTDQGVIVVGGPADAPRLPRVRYLRHTEGDGVDVDAVVDVLLAASGSTTVA
jgi:hypothetical protein